MKKNNKKRKGFTLIELLAVIVIIAIIALIGIPVYNYVIKKSKESIYLSNALGVIEGAKIYTVDSDGENILLSKGKFIVNDSKNFGYVYVDYKTNPNGSPIYSAFICNIDDKVCVGNFEDNIPLFLNETTIADSKISNGDKLFYYDNDDYYTIINKLENDNENAVDLEFKTSNMDNPIFVSSDKIHQALQTGQKVYLKGQDDSFEVLYDRLSSPVLYYGTITKFIPYALESINNIDGTIRTMNLEDYVTMNNLNKNNLFSSLDNGETIEINNKYIGDGITYLPSTYMYSEEELDVNKQYKFVQTACDSYGNIIDESDREEDVNYCICVEKNKLVKKSIDQLNNINIILVVDNIPRDEIYLDAEHTKPLATSDEFYKEELAD